MCPCAEWPVGLEAWFRLGARGPKFKYIHTYVHIISIKCKSTAVYNYIPTYIHTSALLLPAASCLHRQLAGHRCLGQVSHHHHRADCPLRALCGLSVARKTERYTELLGTCRDAGYKANLLTLEVDSRGFSNTDSFDKLYHTVFSCHQSQTGDGTHVPATVLLGLVQAQLERASHVTTD